MKYFRMLSQALMSVGCVSAMMQKAGLRSTRSSLEGHINGLTKYYAESAAGKNASPILLVLEQVKGRSLTDFQTKLLWAQQELLAMRKHKLEEGN